MLVKKKNGKWRVCIDFTSLNSTCPKDDQPLPRFDQLVEATSGHDILSFMDAYSGYNQVRIHPPDEEKTAFVTDSTVYCYKRMSLGLKNAGATYQRLVNLIFEKLIPTSMAVYVDDMLIKSLHRGDHIPHLEESFKLLR